VALVQRLASVSNQYPQQWLGCLRRVASDEVVGCDALGTQDCLAEG
jgi:hypothetical protein